MDNQKQLEEMIRDLIPFLVKKEFVEEILKQPFSYFDSMYEDEKAICRELIRLKYRKFPENMVMISREEYDGLKKEAEHYDPFWFCTFGGCEGACKECRNTCEMSIFVKERKETAREILNEFDNLQEILSKKIKQLKEPFRRNMNGKEKEGYTNGILAAKSIVTSFKSSLAKQHGVEVE
jgi:hypothetical protein